MTSEDFWVGIANVAQWKKLSCSGLAKFCGLDPTTFNKSKRLNRDGSPHWPSTYTLSRVLNTLEMSLADFSKFMPVNNPSKSAI